MGRTGTGTAGFKPTNKIRRQSEYHERLKARGKAERDRNHTRRREETRNPRLRQERLANNVPHTIDNKRVFDEVDIEDGDGIGYSVDVERLKRRKTTEDEQAKTDAGELTETNLKKVEAIGDGSTAEEQVAPSEEDGVAEGSEDDDLGSLMDSGSEGAAEGLDGTVMPPPPRPKVQNGTKRAASPPASTTSTNLTHIPDALAARFPSVFHPPEAPKILITTTIDSTLHQEAEMLTGLFPNSDYIRRTKYRYRIHRPSIREICTGAQKRGYTTVMILGEDKKRPSSLQIIHIPQAPSPSTEESSSPEEPNGPNEPQSTNTTQPPQPIGPTFTFTLKNFIPSSRISGHGNPTPHYPELLLNNFRTPLGLLTASLLKSLFPSSPEIGGRQVITFHDQRDYIFVRRHRYVFRDRKGSEKKVTGTDGRVVKGAEEVKAGLQELGPRFTMKLRRVDEGVGRGSKRIWEWRAGDEKVRTRFAL